LSDTTLSKRLPRIQPLDLLILLVLVFAGAYLVHRIRAVLDYRWNWGLIWEYVLRYDQQSERWVPSLLLQGLFTTIRLSVWSTLLAVLVGAVMGLWRVSSSLFKRLVGTSYVGMVRNLPPLVWVFLFYYFVSDQIMPLLGVDDFVRGLPAPHQELIAVVLAPPAQITAFVSAVITLGLYEGAYITEIVRAGVESIERGQWEAAYSLGLSWWQQMRRVILPQALQRILPPLAGQFISTIKDSAIVSVISISELTFQGLQLMASTYLTFEIWITIGVMYGVLTLGCSLTAARLERSMRH
jgi:polar amino acid transport system permease protein